MIENEYRYYIYDFLIGQHLLTIDTVGKRSRIDTFNIYGQCSTLDREWDRITKHTINRALRRSGYVYDKYILEHFTNSEISVEKEPLFKTNNYNDCIKFLADYGAKNHNYMENTDHMDYYKKYLEDTEEEQEEME